MLALGHGLMVWHASPSCSARVVCHSARGSPAHLSGGNGVTVEMPKITAANGGDAERTDQ